MSNAKLITTVEELAKLAGVTLIDCDPEWGGRVGYKMADFPNMSICGFRTEKAALDSWMNGAFGEQTTKALKAVMKQAAMAKAKKS